MVDEDMTIIHDRAHPKYSTEAEEAFNARMKASMAASEKDGHDEAEVSFCETNNTDESMAGVLPWRSGAWTRYVSEEPGGVQGVGDDGSPLFHPNSSLTLTGQVSVKQEASVGLEPTKRHAPGVDLSKLSANTLKLLGRAANTLSRSSVPVNVYPNDELQLTTIVDRLNQAAAKNKRSHTSHENSVDGSLSSSQSSSNSREGTCNSVINVFFFKLCLVTLAIMALYTIRSFIFVNNQMSLSGLPSHLFKLWVDFVLCLPVAD